MAFRAPVNHDLFNSLDIDYKMIFNELESYRFVTADPIDWQEYSRVGETGWRMLEHFIEKLK
ncbi:MAG TPA: hypothetical protein VJM32_05035 [Candidatus Saccharimonadales bacterium]|nr:hypothetical protein [Candidatus Saccharimonadales bacterium]